MGTKAFFKELDKLAQDLVDDLEAPPTGRILPQLMAAHKLRKVSSWEDIGPDTAPNREWRPPRKLTKTAEPPPPKGVSLKAWDKILQRGPKPKIKTAYKLQGHTNVQGLRIAIENRKGSVRKGKDADGNEWRTKMKAPYGYLVGTKGADDEAVDAYVGPDKEAPDAYVVHQKDKDTGKFDEDKVLLGVKSKKEAKELFLKHYDSPKFLGPISRVAVERLKELVKSKRKLVRIGE